MGTEWLLLAFFAAALLYSSVGFGGGSTYTALLALSAAGLAEVPIMALACNIVVVTAGASKFAAAGHISWRRFWPIALLSVPFAWLGGYVLLPDRFFAGILAAALGVAGLLMVIQPFLQAKASAGAHTENRLADLGTGGFLGLLAGMTGIGGGIYLSPILHLRRWGAPRQIAGTCALFILVNSISGLAGQVTKLGTDRAVSILADNLLLFPAVLLGGLIGSQFGARIMPEKYVRILTAILVLYVALRLGLRLHTD